MRNFVLAKFHCTPVGARLANANSAAQRRLICVRRPGIKVTQSTKTTIVAAGAQKISLSNSKRKTNAIKIKWFEIKRKSREEARAGEVRSPNCADVGKQKIKRERGKRKHNAAAAL